MIILDTHIWVWWVNGDELLSHSQKEIITENESGEIGVSIISCWEVAKLVQYNRLVLSRSIKEWIGFALDYQGITLIELTPDIVIESTQLPGNFHKDPADQMIVATSRILTCPLITSDGKLLKYEHVEILN